MRIHHLVGAALASTVLATASAAGISNDVVRIGVINDMSGLYADISGEGSATAARMAAEDFGGAVLGKRIEILAADHQNKADIGSAIARRWIDEDRVDMIVDAPNTSVALAVQEITRDKKRIFMISGGASSDLTGKNCSPYGFHWTYDSHAMAAGTGRALSRQGGDTWFLLTADYGFGHAMSRDIRQFVSEAGGKVLGEVRHPLGNPDFSSYILQAQASGAKIIGLANASGDTINSLKQAAEFGVVQAGQRLAGLVVFITDIHSLGLQAAQGLVATNAFYWDMNDETRAFSKRYAERMKGVVPTMIQAGVYSATMHYLKAVAAAGTDDADAVAAKMRETPVKDFMTDNALIRADGRLMRKMYLVQVKSPEESKGPWDYYKILAEIAPEEAARPLEQGNCPYLAK
jgi:branched-chain amino acid transport system substrate-binding protein